jgi:hypothetical protein
VAHHSNLKPWRKGQSGNPGGRPKGEGEVRQLARAYTHEAIKTIVHLMREGPPPIAGRAAEALLDRGCGRPSLEIGVALKAEFSAALNRLESALSPEEFERVLQALAAERCAPLSPAFTDAHALRSGVGLKQMDCEP